MEANKESLEERLERIRLKNEEIEKKHREAEADRIRALKVGCRVTTHSSTTINECNSPPFQDNAMVEVKSPKHEDWPKAHKYDTLEFTYDVDPAAQTQDCPESVTVATADPVTASGRKKKTFNEGDGPPPDPSYNFLADSERDGSDAAERKRVQQQESQTSSFRNKTGSGSFCRQGSSSSGSSGSPNGSVGGGNGVTNTNNTHNNGKGKQQQQRPDPSNPKSSTSSADYRKPLQFEIQPKKNLETNWRERDASEGAHPAPASSPPVVARPSDIDDSAIAATYHSQQPAKKPLPLTDPKQPQQSQIDKRPPALRALVMPNPAAANVAVAAASPANAMIRSPPTDVVPEPLVVEQRGNIQISVSKDGEIQSVKCKPTRMDLIALWNGATKHLPSSLTVTSARAIPGTGRVGLPRAITKQSQPPPAPAQLPSPSAVISIPAAAIAASHSPPIVMPTEAQNPNHFRIPNMAYPPPPVLAEPPVNNAASAAANSKKFSVQDRLQKFQVPT